MTRPIRTFLLASAIFLISLTATANWVGNIQFEFPSHSFPIFGTRAHVTFDYSITNPAGDPRRCSAVAVPDPPPGG